MAPVESSLESLTCPHLHLHLWLPVCALARESVRACARARVRSSSGDGGTEDGCKAISWRSRLPQPFQLYYDVCRAMFVVRIRPTPCASTAGSAMRLTRARLASARRASPAKSARCVSLLSMPGVLLLSVPGVLLLSVPVCVCSECQVCAVACSASYQHADVGDLGCLQGLILSPPELQ